jgi:hypothetical protein
VNRYEPVLPNSRRKLPADRFVRNLTNRVLEIARGFKNLSAFIAFLKFGFETRDQILDNARLMSVGPFRAASVGLYFGPAFLESKGQESEQAIAG